MGVSEEATASERSPTGCRKRNGADTLEGGADTDTLTYITRQRAVRVTEGSVDSQGRSDDGEAGEGDRVAAGVERIEGSSSDDHLVGDSGSEELHGWGGNDRLEPKAGGSSLFGGAGADHLVGANGHWDELNGGSGDDTIDSRDNEGDWLQCGSGESTLDFDEDWDSLDSDCTGPQSASTPLDISEPLTRSGLL